MKKDKRTNRINKLTTKEFAYRPFFMSKINYESLKAMKEKNKYKSFNDLFTKLIGKKNIKISLDK